MTRSVVRQRSKLTPRKRQAKSKSNTRSRTKSKTRTRTRSTQKSKSKPRRRSQSRTKSGRSRPQLLSRLRSQHNYNAHAVNFMPPDFKASDDMRVDEPRFTDTRYARLIRRPDTGLGMSVMETGTLMGAIVIDINKGGAAETSKQIFIGDRLLEVNGESMLMVPIDRVVAALKAKREVDIIVKNNVDVERERLGIRNVRRGNSDADETPVCQLFDHMVPEAHTTMGPEDEEDDVPKTPLPAAHTAMGLESGPKDKEDNVPKTPPAQRTFSGPPPIKKRRLSMHTPGAVDALSTNKTDGPSILIYGGCFCPPHKGHFQNILDQVDKFDKVYVFLWNSIGAKIRHGIDSVTNKTIWDIYRDLLSVEQQNKVEIRLAVVDGDEPYKDGLYSLLPGLADNARITLMIGSDYTAVRQTRIMAWLNQAACFYSNRICNIMVIPRESGGVSATIMTGLIHDNKMDEVRALMPAQLSDDQFNQINELFKIIGHQNIHS